MATLGELFGNDSSSDDDNDETNKQEPGPNINLGSTAGTTNDDSPATAAVDEPARADDDKQDDGNDNGQISEEISPKKKKMPSIMDDDDSEDDNEPEFDDGGAVVGLTSPTMAGVANRPSNAAPMRREEDDLLNDDSSIEAEEEEEEGDTRTLVVQETDSPDLTTKFHLAKMPNLVAIQTNAFDEIEYSKRQEDEDFGKAAFNLIRWRYKTNASGDPIRDNNTGELIRESNTRMVEWEDGSFTMHVGDEVFSIDMIDSSQSSGFPGLNGYLFLSSQAASYKEDGKPAGTVLESMGAIQSRLVIKPTSLQSDAHKILTHGIRAKTIKVSKIAQFATQFDPEKEKQARLKMRSDLDKANVRKRTGTQRPRMSRSYLNEGEDDDYDVGDEDTFNLKAMKRRAMGGGYDDDDSEEEDYGETFRQAKKKKKEESSEDEEMELDDEDEDAPIVGSKKKKQTGVFDDDDSD